jgi:hypothetical protein
LEHNSPLLLKLNRFSFTEKKGAPSDFMRIADNAETFQEVLIGAVFKSSFP